MNNYIVCHYGEHEYLYDIESGKYYIPKTKIITTYNENEAFKNRLKKISNGLEWRTDRSLVDILEKTYTAHSMRQHYRFDLYQTPVLPETSVRRAALIKEKGKKVVLMGDDDLVSIPLALMGHKVTVLDADEFLITLLGEVNKKMNINIQAKCCDFIYEADPSLVGKFDVMYADPVSTKEGYEIFVKRGFEMLKDGGEAYITVTKRFRPVLDDFLKCNKIEPIKVYNSFCNSYNHKLQLIDDVADMILVNKTSVPNIEIQSEGLNFFKSQDKMRISYNLELFDVDSEKIQNQMQSIVIHLRNTMDRVLQINKYISNENIYYFIYADDNSIQIRIAIFNHSQLDINIQSAEERTINKVKKIIEENVSFITKREEAYVCGLPFIQGHIDLDINYLN